ncbi:hypothetical protein BVY03_00705 [bacterium K02(2017)]|nr:hypothetical protein BVY03_00705 [bacterium K02(2017)]
MNGFVFINNLIKFILLLFLTGSLTLLSACGTSSSLTGGIEAGNPPDTARDVVGTVSSTTTSLKLLAAVGTCAADKIIATDSAGLTTQADIDSSCMFTLSLFINKSYSFYFSNNDEFVASLIFNNGTNLLNSNVFHLSSGETQVSLGTITITNSLATPEIEPSTQNDQDMDGTSDFEDTDDDGDGTADTSEIDCDLDGITDDKDDDDSSCDSSSTSSPSGSNDSSGSSSDGSSSTSDNSSDESNESDDDDEDNDDEESSTNTNTATVLQVIPANNNMLNDDNNNISLDQDIEIRFSCSIDTTTVNMTTLNIRDANNDQVVCEFEYESNNTQLECEHDDDFNPNINYTATIDGITCANGTVISSVSWSFHTEEDDD